MSNILSTQQNFRALSVRDLLQARDLYHWHLLNKPNVVATAIGLYLIRKSDLSPEQEKAYCREKGLKRPIEKGERTLQNSEVRNYSWPCVLAFVREWLNASDFGGERSTLTPDQIVPKSLYMPDGRTVPVCVVKVDQGEPDPRNLPQWHWPKGLFGGGMPIIVETQNQTHRATAGCLVTDGHTTYALTSRHVCGAKGEPVFTQAANGRVKIGSASDRHLTRLPFTEIYPEFAGHRTYVNLDVGLIELSDLNDWTSQTFGLGAMGALADLNELNITTRLIDAPVVASGAASGRLEGKIKAMFYRYKSVGGYDYVADFLIAPRQAGQAANEISQTQPGDSGAIWHLVTEQKREQGDEGWTEQDDYEGELRPLALEWGGQAFIDAKTGRSFAFGLATSLTTVCRSLDVEVVTGHNTGVLPYWGQLGHYSIGSFACRALPAGSKLRSLMLDNMDRVSFEVTNLNKTEIADRIREAKANESLIPLADVPDLIWKVHFNDVWGGRDTRKEGFRSAGPEHPTHYADIDEPGPNGGQTLLEMSLADHDNINVDVWRQFYDDLGHNDQHSRGLLPFRVWQFFDAMKQFVVDGEVEKFVCAAGLLSHYVGDACQPLHGSIYADGYPNSTDGDGVHSTYETKMVERKAAKIVEGIELQLGQAAPALPQIQTGKEAALATLELMNRSAQTIPPKDLVDAYIAAGGTSKVAVQDALWDQFSDQTIQVMTDGARVLANIWQGAWTEGGGNNIPTNQLGPADPDVLNGFARDWLFIRSHDIDHIKPSLVGHP